MPIEWISPQNSWPITVSGGIPMPYWTGGRSEPQIPQLCTLSTTSPTPATGSGTSMTAISSFFLNTAAFISDQPFLFAPRTDRRLLLLYQFDLVAVGILDERDGRGAVLHRAGLAHDVDAFLLQVGAGFVDVVDAERDVSVGGADFVLRGAPIPGQLDAGGIVLVPVADKGEGEFAAEEIVLAQQLHPELVAIELERFVEVVDAEHRVQKAHAVTP